VFHRLPLAFDFLDPPLGMSVAIDPLAENNPHRRRAGVFEDLPGPDTGIADAGKVLEVSEHVPIPFDVVTHIETLPRHCSLLKTCVATASNC
jgi:hypothetical protein